MNAEVSAGGCDDADNPHDNPAGDSQNSRAGDVRDSAADNVRDNPAGNPHGTPADDPPNEPSDDLSGKLHHQFRSQPSHNLVDRFEVHGLHVAPAQAGCEVLLWLVPVARADRTRVRQHTCECRATIYELCQAGGLRFIRRTVRGPDGQRVHETERLVAARAERVWLRLLLGQAR
ncbi:hypothetical protein Amac_088180 [Acrocarpospora macrocephala]|uniref:Uncharacterized protein n=1 Tax=Acrocarpospora macrocephala TaxID=150177 RepID=A0A5M3X6C0_9ACTN|nr:hypothetical protein Amac_088180 [Acrocarpospora macrocephala]